MPELRNRVRTKKDPKEPNEDGEFRWRLYRNRKRASARTKQGAPLPISTKLRKLARAALRAAGGDHAVALHDTRCRKGPAKHYVQTVLTNEDS